MIHYLRALAARLRGLLGDRGADQELDDEIETHLRLLTERYVRQGMTADEAAWAARRQFGNVTLLQEVNREMREIRLVETFVQDLRYGVRMLGKDPGFTFVAVLTLALGIGANTAIFSVVNAVLLRPLPYRDPDRIVTVSGRYPNQTTFYLTGRDYLYWRAQAKVFEQFGAYSSSTADLSGNGEPERLTAGMVSADLFATLGVAPTFGRAFTPAEDKPDGAPVVILSHNLWRRHFGGDPLVIGRAITLSGISRTVIGIMPPGFQFPSELDLWLPLALNESLEFGPGPSDLVQVIARLKPGVTLEAARADLTFCLERLEQAFPGQYTGVQCRVIGLRERVVGGVQQALLMMFGAVTFVLLIACANVTNLLLSRAVARQKEMAIRSAVGAGRLRLVRQLLTESLLLSLAGGAAGLLIATWGVKALVRINIFGVARIEQSSVDGRVLGFTCGVAALVGLLAGVFPALQASKTNVNETFKTLPAMGSGRRGVRRSLHALMIAEFALTLTLLIGAGLMIKSFFRLQAVPKGFNSDNVLTLDLSSSLAKYPIRSPQRTAFHQELLVHIQTLPGVHSASIVGFLPLAGRAGLTGFQIEGRPPFEPGKEPLVQTNSISHEYFQTMGIEMRAGRPFTAQDDAESPLVAIINETMARRFWPNENPIGHKFIGRPLSTTIVGVVGDTRHFGLDNEVQPEIYSPYPQEPSASMKLAVRAAPGQSNSGLASLATTIRNQVRTMNPNEPVNQVITMDERISDSVAPRRFQMLLFGVFAAVALAIATAGMYGVLSYVVSQRTHEIGVRMAFGARGADVLRMVIWRGTKLTLIGVMLGLATALALTRVMKNLLFEVSATDPMTFALIALLLVGVALVASYIPARRATKVDPLQALRHE